MSRKTLIGTAAAGSALLGTGLVALYLSGTFACIPQTRIAVRQGSAQALTRPAAEDWPRFRGPRFDQISRETNLADQWPVDPSNPEKSGPPIVWSAEVGLGHSSPIAAAGRVYLFSMNQRKETLTAFDAASGAIAWSVEGGEGWTSSYVGTRASPTIDADRIYTYGGKGDLICRRLSDGNLIWQINVLEQTGSANLTWGLASCPLVDASRVYVQSGKHGSIAVAVDKLTGKLLWKSQATGIGGYAAPIIADVQGTRELICFAGEAIWAINPDTGVTMWQYPWETSYDINASIPLFDPATSRLFITSAYGHGCIQLQLTASGATKVWENKSIESRFQSAILDRGYLYANSEGTLVCVNWNDGSVKWKARDSSMKLGLGGSIVRVDDKLITLSDRGKLSLLTATPDGPTLISQAKILEGSEIWATPLLYAGRLYVKGMQELVCYDISKPQAEKK